MKIGIIGGTGFQDLFTNVVEEMVSTEFGDVAIYTGTCEGKEIVFLPRHGKEHGTLAPFVNYKANMMALKRLVSNASSVYLPLVPSTRKSRSEASVF